MERVKHVWRNAACLLFVTGPFRYSKSNSVTMRSLLKGHVKGKPPPTTKFLDLNSQAEDREDMEMIFVQRHSKSGFMPNVHVFPGGVLDQADYSPKWLTVFSHLNSSFSSLTSTHDLPLYSQIPSDKTPISGEVAFRICAIREMFEEAGVLLVRDKSDTSPLSGVLPGTFRPEVKVLPESVRDHWRRRVHNDATEFVTLCNELNCVPDIWSLVEWSNWLTPRNFRRRYDTIFYMVFSETKPLLQPDGIEVIKSIWMNPSKALKKLKDGEVMLAPPQFSELMKLQFFPSSPCLHSYAICNCFAEGGIRRIQSVRVLSKDRLISLTDLDDLYPNGDPEDWKTEIQHPKSPHLQGKVELVLSQHPQYEYECPKHTAEELLELSHTCSRTELVSGWMDGTRTCDNSANARALLDHIRQYASLYGSNL